jgi:O-methyltransferase involved in polyketide biosynthesis
MEALEKVTLTEEQETLLITLYSRTKLCPQGILDDPKADWLLAELDYDFEGLNVPPGTYLTVCLRAKKMDQYVEDYLRKHPDGIVLHLGCGLDTRFERVDNGLVRWYELDLPDAIELRRKFFDETKRYRMIASSVTHHEWLDAVEKSSGPVMVVAEGLFMYLQEEDVKGLFEHFHKRFDRCEVVFDAFSTLTAERVGRHPSLKKTDAVVRWGIDDPMEMEAWGDWIKLEEEWYFVQAEDIKKLKFCHRLMFKMAGMFEVANKAQRILRVSIEGKR